MRTLTEQRRRFTDYKETVAPFAAPTRRGSRLSCRFAERHESPNWGSDSRDSASANWAGFGREHVTKLQLPKATIFIRVKLKLKYQHRVDELKLTARIESNKQQAVTL